MSSKEIESILLCEREGTHEKLYELLEISNGELLREIFDILFNKVVSGPLDEAEMILDSIERMALTEGKKDFKTWIAATREIVYRFSNFNVNEDIRLKNMKCRLLDIIRRLNENKSKKKSNNLYNIYESMVFKDKNLEIIELILKEDKGILGKKDKKGYDLFYNVLDFYGKLDENSEEVNYFYDVIMLFIKYQENVIIRYKDSYIELLEKEEYKNKRHIINICSIFQGLDNIPVMELKRRYDIGIKREEEIIREINGFKWNEDGRIEIPLTFMTIDGEDAMCLDDALAICENDDGSYYFYIAITDVASLIPYQSLTFYEAMRKNETLYLCDDVISLYPDILSYDLCSLVQGQRRPAIVYRFFVDSQFNIDIDSMKIIKGIITVKKRLSYGDVNKGINVTPLEYKMLENMYLVAMKLRKSNGYREDYRKLENLINTEATYHHSLFADKSISANIVEESMLLVNHGSARYFNLRGLIYLFRNLVISKEKEIKEAINKLLQMDKEEINSKKYQNIIMQIKEMYLNAFYSTINMGHEGLGYDAYSHSSSAARRFCDNFNQYLTYFQVFNGIISDKDYYELEETAKEVVTYINLRKRENSKFESEYNYLRMRGKLLERKK